MNRRNFFRVSSLAAAAVTLGNFSKTGSLFASSKGSSSFSLELITDNSSKAIKLAEEFLSDINTGMGAIKFSEYSLDNTERGDIVFFSEGELLNYKNTTSETSASLKEIAKELELPKIISNPVRLRFSSDNTGSAAKNFLVFHKQKMIHKISTDENNLNLTINGSKSELTLNINSGKARVVKAGCTHKNCVNSGSISLSNESIVCIPNEIHIIAE
ncbi:MAG: NusG domain II-containing protein [Ignavibacteria bacterium]